MAIFDGGKPLKMKQSENHALHFACPENSRMELFRVSLSTALKNGKLRYHMRHCDDHGVNNFLLKIISLVISLYAAASLAAPENPTTAGAANPVVLVAGDVAQCNVRGAQLTADLIRRMPEATVLAVGDLAYENGSPKDFARCYDPSWGKFKDRTWPAPGNHEYGTSGATGYFTYFGSRAGAPGKGYYSVEIGQWHIVALNSNIDADADSAQVDWLRKDLAAHRASCILAFWHHPRYSSGAHGSHRRVQALWETLHEHGASIVIAGHDHHYERFAPLDAQGRQTATGGIRSFVVGTGGARLYNFGLRGAHSAAWQGETWGVLKLTLHADSYDWEFLSAQPGTFQDKGSSPCANKLAPEANAVALER